MTFRLVFMGTPDFAVPTLAHLIERGQEVVAVYSQPPRPAGRGHKERPSPVQQLAEKHGIAVFTPTSLKREEVQRQFAAHKADAAIVAAYGLILPPPILAAFSLGCINVHPSKLPRWRGAAPIPRTLMAGDDETAMTIMQMDKGLDTGDILRMETFPIADGTTAGALHDRLAAMAGPMVMEALEGLQSGSLTPIPQPAKGVTYAEKLSKPEARIDWNQPAETVRQHILGLSPWPGAWTEYGGEKLKVLEAEPAPPHTRHPENSSPPTRHRRTCSGSWEAGSEDPDIRQDDVSTQDDVGSPDGASPPPGTLLDDRLSVACNPGSLRLTRLQRSGKKPMHAEAFLRGYAISKGNMLSHASL